MLLRLACGSALYLPKPLPGKPTSQISITQHYNIDLFFFCYARIRVNAISPGVVLTDRVRGLLSDDDPIRLKTPLGPSEPEDAAPLAVYLASDESRQVTGAILPMDGGASVV